MWAPNEEDLLERQRRIDAAISRAQASYMSDAKWRKLFALLRDQGIRSLRWKFVGASVEIPGSLPDESDLLDDRFGDSGPYPYGPYREIEWVEIPAENSRGIADALARVGRFRTEACETGLRVLGYSW
jgi:hypothetical protein